MGLTRRRARVSHATSATLARRCVTSGILFASGDAIAQRCFSLPGEEYDPARTARNFVYGSCVYAPVIGVWLSQLNKVVFRSKAKQVAARVALDQSVAGPGFPALYFACTTLMEGGSLADVSARLRSAWFETWKVGVCVYAPASAVNLSLVPPQNRVVFISAVGLAWSTYLAYMNNRHRLLDTGSI